MQLFRFEHESLKVSYEFKAPTLSAATLHLEGRFGEAAAKAGQVTVRENFADRGSPFVSTDALYAAEKDGIEARRQRIEAANAEREVATAAQRLIVEKKAQSYLPPLEPAPPANRGPRFDVKPERTSSRPKRSTFTG